MNVMGEAKRRKTLDPNYGKPKPPIAVELAAIPAPPKEKLLPDFGAYCLKTFGNRPITLEALTNYSVMIRGSEGYIQFNAGGYMATVITTPEIALRYKDNPFPLMVKPDERDRYLTETTKEWVVPLKLLEQP